MNADTGAAVVPRGSFRSRVARGTAANIIRQAINVVTQIAAVPVFLACWGNQAYGEWQLLSAAVAYMTLLDFGMQSYVVNRMGQCFARGDVQELNRILHSAVALSLAACALALAVLAPIMLALPVTEWFDLRSTGPVAAKVTLCLLAVQTAGMFPIGIVAGVYRASGEYARDVAISNIYRAALLAATLLVVLNGGGVVAVAALQTVFVLCALLYICRDVARRNPTIRVGVAQADIRLAGSFVGPSLLFLVMQVSAAASIQGSTLMVGASLGAGVVAVLATIRALVNVIPQVTNAVSAALWPEVTTMEASRRYSELDSLHRLAAKIILALSLMTAVWLHFTGEHLVRLWTGGRIRYDQTLMDTLLLLQIVVAWQLMSSVVLSASNNHRRVAVIRLLSSVAGLSLGWALIPRAGAAGCIFGVFAAEAVVGGVATPIYACRLLGGCAWEFFTEVLGRGLISGLGIYIVSAIAASLDASPIPRVLAVGSAVVCAGVAAIWAVWLNGSERRRLSILLNRRYLPAAANA